MKTITRVGAGETIRHQGDLTITQDVAEDATVIITEGSLIIEGNVGHGARLQVSLSDALRNQSLMNVSLSSIGSFSVGSRVTYGTLMVGGNVVSRGNSIRANLMMNDRYIGNVSVDNRIFTNDALIRHDNDVFEIIPADSSKHQMVLFGGMGSSSSSMASSQTLARATIDGQAYQGTKIRVNGKHVTVDGMASVTAPSAVVKDDEPISPSKLHIKGMVANFVIINSDADMEISGIGNDCQITSTHNGLTARNIGQRTRIKTKQAITVADVGNDSYLESSQYGIKFHNLAERVTVQAREAIEGEDIANGCDLASQLYGLTAGNIGADVTVNVREAIKVKNVGIQSKLSSQLYGINAHHVADSVTIAVRDSIKLLSVGNHCRISSALYGISIAGDVKNQTTLTCRDELFVESLGHNCQVTSTHNKVKIRGNAGDNCVIHARDSVCINNIGHHAEICSSHGEVITRNIGSHVTILAKDDIVVNGVSPNPASCRFNTRGRVTKPEMAVSSGYSTTTLFRPLHDASRLPESSPLPMDEVPEHLCCKITMDLMQDPVICLLDGLTYERSMITRWLTDHRMTPQRNPMLPGQNVADVLILNRGILDAIEDYRSKLPKTHSSS